MVYFLGIGNVLYGVDADIERKPENRQEHIRRLGEVANLMLDAGIILIVTAAELHPGRPRADQDGGATPTGSKPSGSATASPPTWPATLVLSGPGGRAERIERIKWLLQDKGDASSAPW